MLSPGNAGDVTQQWNFKLAQWLVYNDPSIWEGKAGGLPCLQGQAMLAIQKDSSAMDSLWKLCMLCKPSRQERSQAPASGASISQGPPSDLSVLTAFPVTVTKVISNTSIGPFPGYANFRLKSWNKTHQSLNRKIHQFLGFPGFPKFTLEICVLESFAP